MTITDLLLGANLVATIGFGVAIYGAIFTIHNLRANDDAWIGTRVDQIWKRTVADGLDAAAINGLNSDILAARQRAGWSR